LAATQTVPPVQERAADDSASRGGGVASKARPNPISPPSTHSNPSVSMRQPTAAMVPPETNKASEIAQNSISVSKLFPPLTVVTKRDWADWGYWVFGGLLVIVGFLQVWLLRRNPRSYQTTSEHNGTPDKGCGRRCYCCKKRVAESSQIQASMRLANVERAWVDIRLIKRGPSHLFSRNNKLRTDSSAHKQNSP